MYIIFVQNVWICRKIDCLELRKFNGKLCSLNLRNVRISREIEYPELRKLKEKLCTLYMHRMADLQKIWIFRIPKIQREIVYIIYIRNVWISRKIESPELRKFNEKFFTIYMYWISRFVEKLNIQYWGNSMGNCVRFMYVMSRFADKLNIQNCENWTGNCVHYMYKMSGFGEKLIV